MIRTGFSGMLTDYGMRIINVRLVVQDVWKTLTHTTADDQNVNAFNRKDWGHAVSGFPPVCKALLMKIFLDVKRFVELETSPNSHTT
jgi:hypothetical protein